MGTSHIRPVDRSLVAASAVALVVLVVIAAVAAGCATGFSRPDNRVAMLVLLSCALIVGWVGLRPTKGLDLVAQFALGILAGMNALPSLSGIFTLVLLVIGGRRAVRSETPAAHAGALVLGLVVGAALIYGALTALAPADIRC